eukprot:TRINITY_DN808_c2_g1_i1.p1 TRINITY_DN808_c2_g1~~TRINITY_DN808_c2_g1_i1.p1  ORF type:complete len:903 (+),score=272.08 TRINITY_DN808_c2_g1_i1:46-2754(+)
MADVIHLKPNYYTHVQDRNQSCTKLLVGPATFTRKEHEQILLGAQKFIVIPPRHYCIIQDPVVLTEAGEPKLDQYGQALVRLGDQEVRMDCDPFPLYPGESMLTPKPLMLQILEANTANRIKAIRDFDDVVDGKTVRRMAGDEWLEAGPRTYIPHVCKQVEAKVVRAEMIGPNEALKLRATSTFVDKNGVERKVGSEWLISEQGAYLPSVDEMVVEIVKSRILTEKKGIHLKCNTAFKDVFGQDRKPGDTWLVTHKDTESYTPTPSEDVLKEVDLLVLHKRQFCIVLDPYNPETKQTMLGVKKLIRGPARLFLHPDERLENGLQNVYVLQADEALLLEALEACTESNKEAGDLWMIRGPCEYVPPVEVKIRELRRAIPMHEYEGVYVRDLKSGVVRSQMGPNAYLLQPTEELWEKQLSPEVERLLDGTVSVSKATATPAREERRRDKTRVVVYSVPHNSICQIFDYKRKTSRFIAGPDLVALGPDEEFTVISLSGDKPKVPNRIKTLALFLGPDFMTDNVRIETADHARLELTLSYNWKFEIDSKKEEECKSVFSVPDFVGDSCKAIASRIRGCCAGETFDNFHQNSSSIIRHAVFGSYDCLLACGRPLEVGTPVSGGGTVTAVDGYNVSVDGKQLEDPTSLIVCPGGVDTYSVRKGKWPNQSLKFPNNSLVISNVDIQTVEPVDQKTKDSLMKSVQLAIHITTQGQEAQAKHKATEEEQKARGELESHLIRDKAESEKERKVLLQLKAESQAIETTGAQRAEAVAASEAAKVEAENMVALAKKKAEAQAIQVTTEIELENTKNEEELNHKQALDDLEVTKAKEMGRIEAEKFKKTVNAIGKETISAIAKAGPENQVRLLKALNLQGYMVTDGSSPINLFNAAQGMTGAGGVGGMGGMMNAH